MTVLPVSSLPFCNAVLNATSGVLLVLGYSFIRRGRVAQHKACMVGAFICSAVFLSSYLYYHFHVGVVRFSGQGWIRPAYFVLLTSHTVLAVAILPLAVITLRQALTNRFAQHRRIARWTLPLWLYVSVTGVVVYWLLYRAYIPIYSRGT